MHDHIGPKPPAMTTNCPTCGQPGYHPPRFDADGLVAAIILLVGDKTFSVHDLTVLAALTDGPLRQAIGGLSAKKLGKKLSGLLGQRFGDVTLERIDRDNSGTIWQLRRV
jgi:hypothetical protein